MAAPPPEHFNMKIVEQKVSAGNCDIFELVEFLSRPLYAHLAHNSDEGPRFGFTGTEKPFGSSAEPRFLRT